MSGGFDEREKAFEAKFVHDEELQFKIVSRRNKLVGLWAAGEMGLSGAAAEAYAKDVVVSDLTEEDMVRKIQADFQAKGVARTDHLIRVKIAEFLESATDQVKHETGK